MGCTSLLSCGHVSAASRCPRILWRWGNVKYPRGPFRIASGSTLFSLSHALTWGMPRPFSERGPQLSNLHLQTCFVIISRSSGVFDRQRRACQLCSRSTQRCAINNSAPRTLNTDQLVRVRCTGRTGLKITASSASAIVQTCQPRRSKLCNEIAPAQTNTTKRKTR